MHYISFNRRDRSAPTRWGAYSVLLDPKLDLRGLLLREREGRKEVEGRSRLGKERGERRGGEGERGRIGAMGKCASLTLGDVRCLLLLTLCILLLIN